MALLSLLSMRITIKFYDRVFPLSHTSGQGCFLFWALCCYLVTLLLGSWLLWYSPHFWPCAFGPFLRVPSQTLETGWHAFTEPTEVWKVGFSLSWKDSGRGHAFTSAQTAAAAPFCLHMCRKLRSWLFPRTLNLTGPGLSSDSETPPSFCDVPSRLDGTWKLMSSCLDLPLKSLMEARKTSMLTDW